MVLNGKALFPLLLMGISETDSVNANQQRQQGVNVKYKQSFQTTTNTIVA